MDPATAARDIQFSPRAESSRRLLARLRARFLTIDPLEASFDRRGFAATDVARRERLESIGGAFVRGFNHAIVTAAPHDAEQAASGLAPELTGFVFEGAGMGFALLDLLSPVRTRHFQSFITNVASHHVYMALVGAGWAFARTSSLLAWRLGPLDPLLRWLTFDGMGFHAGYFAPRVWIDGQRRPTVLRGYGRNAFDQGLGRSLWFAKGAVPYRVAHAVSRFHESRWADLWSGVGLAAAYAGGVDRRDLFELRLAAGQYRHHLGQGAAFAAKARQRAGNPVAHTDLACQVLCGLSAADAATLTDVALNLLPSPSVAPASPPYEHWRSLLRSSLAQQQEP